MQIKLTFQMCVSDSSHDQLHYQLTLKECSHLVISCYVSVASYQAKLLKLYLFIFFFFLNYLDREKAASAGAVFQLRPVYSIHHYINKLLM